MIGAAGVRYVRAYGTPFSLGYTHGTRLARVLRQFLEDEVCRLNLLLPNPVSLASLRPCIDAYGSEIATSTPNLFEEVCGLAHGADITMQEALLLQLRREIMGYQRVPSMGDCTTYARVSDSDPTTAVLAQTIDLSGNLDDFISVLRLGDSRDGRESLILSFGGLLGYLGLNKEGLAIGINLVLGGRWRVGLPPYLVVRHLLDTAGTVDEAVSILRGLRVASSRTITLCDATKAAFVEILDDQFRVIEGRQTIHTNHFLCEDFKHRDELNVFARNSSMRRLDACHSGLFELSESASAEDHLGLLSNAPLCVPDRGEVRLERTVGAAVMFPARRELHLRPGNPSLSRTQVFTLR
jgi:hypothetical protein